MKLYGHAVSLTTWQVLFALAEKRCDAEQIAIDVTAREQRGAAHLARHPFGHIPVIEDGDFRLYETHAILRYLDDAFPDPPLSPTTPRDRAVQSQWLCIEQNYLEPAAKKIFARGYAKMMGDPDPGEASVAEGRHELAQVLDVFAQHIDGREAITGTRFSLADLCWATFVDELTRTLPGEMALCDARWRHWLDRVRARPAWAASAAARATFGTDTKEMSHD